MLYACEKTNLPFLVSLQDADERRTHGKTASQGLGAGRYPSPLNGQCLVRTPSGVTLWRPAKVITISGRVL